MSTSAETWSGLFWPQAGKRFTVAACAIPIYRTRVKKHWTGIWHTASGIFTKRWCAGLVKIVPDQALFSRTRYVTWRTRLCLVSCVSCVTCVSCVLCIVCLVCAMCLVCLVSCVSCVSCILCVLCVRCVLCVLCLLCLVSCVS